MRRELFMFIVVAINKATGEHEFLYQEAYNAQHAVDKIREWSENGYEFVDVARIMKGWK